MALQAFANNLGTLISPMPSVPYTHANATVTLDAVGESVGFVGRLHLPGGPGTSKTISSAGGTIAFQIGATVPSDGSTNIRIGIQDVGATGLEDGTYDVQADWVPGVETFTANVVNVAAMESGTKTITHGDLIAVVIEMTARGASDAMTVLRGATASMFPYITVDAGSGPVISAANPRVTITFDDGTVGTLGANTFVTTITSAATFSLSTDPDELALIFQLPFKAQLLGVQVELSGLAATEDFEIILYSTPLGTPAVVEAVAIDMSMAGLAGVCEAQFTTYRELSINTDYAIAIRPTTTGAFFLGICDFGSGNSALRKPTMLGEHWNLGHRTDQTGAFTETTTVIPRIALVVNELSDDVSGGGWRPRLRRVG